MGAGKTTLGCHAWPSSIGRQFFDLDQEIEQSRAGARSPTLRARRRGGFRVIEAERDAENAQARAARGDRARRRGDRDAGDPRRAPRARADRARRGRGRRRPGSASRGSARPLASDAEQFRALYERRRGLYEEAADARARDARRRRPRRARRSGSAGARAEGDALLADRAGARAPPARARRTTSRCARRPSPRPQRLWSELGIGRDGTIVGYGGGTTTDLAGFVAATYMRGVRWIACRRRSSARSTPGSAARRRSTCREGKNLVGAFHYPGRVVIDPALLATLPEEERRNGMAEVVKTGLLAGRRRLGAPGGGDDPRLRRLQGGCLPRGSLRAERPPRDPQPRPHLRRMRSRRPRYYAAPPRRGRRARV